MAFCSSPYLTRYLSRLSFSRSQCSREALFFRFWAASCCSPDMGFLRHSFLICVTRKLPRWWIHWPFVLSAWPRNTGLSPTRIISSSVIPDCCFGIALSGSRSALWFLHLHITGSHSQNAAARESRRRRRKWKRHKLPLPFLSSNRYSAPRLNGLSFWARLALS